MESDVMPPGAAMPRSPSFEPARAESVASTGSAHSPVSVDTIDRTDRNNVFCQLVKDDSDIAGLVAYSIYKQNKLDWLRAFETARARAPDENELAAYIIGEGTPRRLATYRHLAEATLAGNGPEIDGAGAVSRPAVTLRRSGRETMAGSVIALYALIAVLAALGFYLAMHYTAATR